MDRVQSLDGLELNDHAVLNNQIHVQLASDSVALVVERNLAVRFDMELMRLKFNPQAFVIDGFKQPRPECSVNFDGTTDYGFRQRLDFSGSLIHAEA
jgi:hypothetical protein